MNQIRGLRIAHLIETDGPGGAERVLSHLAKEFRAREAENVVFLPEGREGWLHRELTASGVDVEPFRLERPISPGFVHWLRNRFRHRGVDIAHSHEFSMGFYGSLAARWARIPHVITMHGGKYYAERARRRWALKGAAHLSGAMVAVSAPLRDSLSSELGLPRDGVRLVPNGVPASDPVSSTLRQELGLDPEAKLAVAVGNLYSVKGYEHLIRALALLTSTLPDVHVAVAGRGGLREQLERQASELGVQSRLHLLGLRGDIPNVLAAGDMYVLPSLSEGLPMALLEAMFAGVPAVATRVGQVPDVLDEGRCGMLVPPRDAEALAEAMRRLLRDPDQAREMAAKARRRAEESFSVDRMVDRYAEMYAGLLSRRRNGRSREMPASDVPSVEAAPSDEHTREAAQKGSGLAHDRTGAHGTDGTKVLMVDPSGATYAVTHNLTNALAEHGLNVEVFSGPHWERSVKRDRCSYRVRGEYCRRSQLHGYENSGASRVLWRGVRLLEHQAAMLALVRSASSYDLVHVQWLPLPLTDLAWLRRIADKAPLAYTVHNLLPHGSRNSRAAAALYRRIYQLPDVFFVHTAQTERGLVEQFDVDPSRIVRIHHGSMDHFLDPAPGEAAPASPSDDTPPDILFFGQIREDKGLDVLIRAAGLLRSRGVRFRLTIAGKPRIEMAPLLQMIDDLDLRDVTDLQLGFVDEEDIPGLFERAALVALPYREIDQSGVAVTACTFGKALVASRCGGLAELVEEGGNGLLVPPEDPGSLADALQRLLTDEDRRTRYGRNSKHLAETALSWDGIAAATMDGYRRCLWASGSIVVPADSAMPSSRTPTSSPR